jgi:hypothetical protein
VLLTVWSQYRYKVVSKIYILSRAHISFKINISNKINSCPPHRGVTAPPGVMPQILRTSALTVFNPCTSQHRPFSPENGDKVFLRNDSIYRAPSNHGHQTRRNSQARFWNFFPNAIESILNVTLLRDQSRIGSEMKTLN